MRNFPIFIAAVLGVACLGQEKPAFEAATVKLAAPNAIQNQMIRISPIRMSIPSMNLTWLVYTAYGEGLNTSALVTGGPDWMNKTAYAIEGQSREPASEKEFRAMLRTLLEDRFALKVHIEISEGNVLGLTLDRSDGKLGPKVQPWDGTCSGGRMPTQDEGPLYPRCLSGYRGNTIVLDGATMYSVAELLSFPISRNLLGGVVQDRTGLTERYRMTLDYPFAAARPADPAALPDQPSLANVIREQWGLKLVQTRGPFKKFVVEDAQRPSDN